MSVGGHLGRATSPSAAPFELTLVKPVPLCGDCDRAFDSSAFRLPVHFRSCRPSDWIGIGLPLAVLIACAISQNPRETRNRRVRRRQRPAAHSISQPRPDT